MKKLADISAFECLGTQGGLSDISVFNMRLAVEVTDWEEFKDFIQSHAPGDWQARRFDVVDDMSDESKEYLFGYLEDIYLSSATDDKEWFEPLNDNLESIESVIDQLEEGESESDDVDDDYDDEDDDIDEDWD